MGLFLDSERPFLRKSFPAFLLWEFWAAVAVRMGRCCLDKGLVCLNNKAEEKRGKKLLQEGVGAGIFVPVCVSSSDAVSWKSCLVLPGTEQMYIPAHPKGSGMEGERKGFAKLAWPECDTRTGNESLPAGQLRSTICIKRSTPRQGENDTRPPSLAWIKSAAHSACWLWGSSPVISPFPKKTHIPLSALSQPTEPHTFQVWLLLKRSL